MTSRTTRRFLRILLTTGALTFCALLAYRDTAIGGIQGSGYRSYSVIGRITGFGSIFVDGVEYPTSQARMSINEQPGSESQLRVGQIISIQGRMNRDGSIGEASEVSYFGDAFGPITQIDHSTGTFVVLGQTVRIVAATLFDENIQPASITGLRIGTWVEVSAWHDADGNLIASRIDLKTSSSTLQVKGAVMALDTVARTFEINALTVHYADASIEGQLINGAAVQARGGATSADSAGFWASDIRVLPGSALLAAPSPANVAYERGKPRAAGSN